jgi:hypothetical protein
MEFSEEGWKETNDSLWQFCDELNVSRFERFGLSDATFFRLATLQRNAGAFGLGAEEISRLPEDRAGCWLHLYGVKFAHGITVNADRPPVQISLDTCELDRPEIWTPRFEGRDTPTCWLYLLQKVADIEGIGFAGTEGVFEVPH